MCSSKTNTYSIQNLVINKSRKKALSGPCSLIASPKLQNTIQSSEDEILNSEDLNYLNEDVVEKENYKKINEISLLNNADTLTVDFVSDVSMKENLFLNLNEGKVNQFDPNRSRFDPNQS